MIRSFRYRLKSNQQIFEKAKTWMELCCNLYNVALQEKIQHYRKGKKKLSCYEQYGEIPELRKSFPEYSSIDVQLLRDVLNRLDRSFEGFFKRLKTGEKSGFPRFRSVDRLFRFSWIDILSFIYFSIRSYFIV